MNQFIASNHPLVSALWQSVSRHLEVRESIESCAKLLSAHSPLASLTVYRVNVDQLRARAVCVWSLENQSSLLSDVELTENERRQLERWMRENELLHRTNDEMKACELVRLLQQPAGVDDFVLAPLAGEHGSTGVMIAGAGSKRKFCLQDMGLFEVARDAMAVALDNDSRLCELASLREAAEADRQSLLRRLGRSNIGDSIVGEDSGLAHVLQRVDLVGRSEVPVLILGETGTGKELIARAIHDRSARHAGPFLRVNCGAIPPELIDSQLFGHERGSFTGASETRQGWFERADMGTLFLDEIGELPLEAQVRFLRVLQDGFIERVGGAKAVRVNVRVVAATHRDLASMVHQGTFREDLWYRIAVFPILLPPLRDRVEDIPAFVRHFAERAAIRFGLAPVTPSEEEIELLKVYHWPGNIRELGAVVDRAAILGDGHSLELGAALGVAVPIGLKPGGSHRNGSTFSNGGRIQQIGTLNDAIRSHIETALLATDGRIEGMRGAARLLGVNPHTLRARMRKLKINWSTFRKASVD